MYFDGSLKM
jgi:ribonuclease HI